MSGTCKNMFGFEIPGNSPIIPNIDGFFRSNRKRRFDFSIKTEFDDISEDDEDDKLETLMPAKMDDPLFGSQSGPGIHGPYSRVRLKISVREPMIRFGNNTFAK